MTRPEYEGEPRYQPNQPPETYPPTYQQVYPVNQQPQFVDPNTEKARQDFFNVAKWGVWTWIAVTVVPILLVLACCGFCLVGGAIGSVSPDQ